MSIYLNSVRFDIKAGRIRTRYWTNTHDMLADCGTKLVESGRVVDTALPLVMRDGLIYLQGDYKANGGSIGDIKEASFAISWAEL